MYEMAAMNLLNSALLNTNPVALLPASAGTKATLPTTSFAEIAAVEQVRAVENQQSGQVMEGLPDLSPIEEFKRYMEMSPAEKMLYSVLAEKGMTIEEYNELPAEEKAKIDELVEERLREYRDARELDRTQTKGVAQYQLMQMNTPDKDGDHRLADIFI
ncbi:hypothetical protein ABMA57_05365 [Saccharospirillum sp. HFRX-1]|uniref:hypothetical protein n=1 Tax=unclassified Saccharospirillum TaxID=2633430 RepID=UPI00371927F2